MSTASCHFATRTKSSRVAEYDATFEQPMDHWSSEMPVQHQTCFFSSFSGGRSSEFMVADPRVSLRTSDLMQYGCYCENKFPLRVRTLQN